MDIDLSVFKNIDFTKTDNLIFLGIVLVTAVIAIWVLFFILGKIFRAVWRMIIVAFNLDVAKPKFDKKNSTEWLHQPKNDNVPKMKILGGHPFGDVNVKDKKAEDMRGTKTQGQEVEEKILESLAKLKSGGTSGEATLESKMPTRVNNQSLGNLEEKEGVIVSQFENQEIKIPVPHKISAVGSTGQPVVTVQSQGVELNPRSSVLREKSEIPQNIDKVKGVSGDETLVQKAKEGATQDSIMFKGRKEVSRIKLAHELRRDSKIWQAAKKSGLTLTPLERSKLVKEVFSKVYGGNISKSDLKWGVKKLNRKMLGEKGIAEHAKIRKEINFLKKIGGIK